MSVSWWHREMVGNDTLSADICIIGGGIAGLSAADACARRGASVVLLERHTLGWGASTRNAGYLMRGAADNYAAACDAFGRERARALWRDSELNLALLIDRFGIDRLSTFRAVPSCLVAMSDDEAADIRRSASLMNEDSFAAPLIESGDDTLWSTLRPAVGLVNPGDASINPAELLGRVGAVVRKHEHITVIEDAEVFDIRGDGGNGGNAVISTARVTVRAPRVLLCTNAYARELLPELAGKVVPNRGQMLALRHPAARLDASYYLDRGSEYIRQAPDGTIVVGGMRKAFAADERTAEPSPTESVQRALEAFAERVLGPGGEVVARWAGTMGFTADGLPIVHEGAVDGLEPAGPCSAAASRGHGMSLGAITASRAIERLLG